MNLKQLEESAKYTILITVAISLINVGITLLQQGKLEYSLVALTFGVILLLVYAYFFMETAKRMVLLQILEQTEGERGN